MGAGDRKATRVRENPARFVGTGGCSPEGRGRRAADDASSQPARKPDKVEASQTVEVRAKVRALQWISDEFPEEYKQVLAQGVAGPKKALADRHRGRVRGVVAGLDPLGP